VLTWRSGSDKVGEVAYLVQGDNLLLTLANGAIKSPMATTIVHTACHFGGRRPWLLCPRPRCNRRCAVLFVHARSCGFDCRRCAGVAYATESLDWFGRSWARQARIEQALGPHGIRPKGMHKRTYLAKRLRLMEIEMARDDAIEAGIRKFGGVEWPAAVRWRGGEEQGRSDVDVVEDRGPIVSRFARYEGQYVRVGQWEGVCRFCRGPFIVRALVKRVGLALSRTITMRKNCDEALLSRRVQTFEERAHESCNCLLVLRDTASCGVMPHSIPMRSCA
jgi:hypothetical protein